MTEIDLGQVIVALTPVPGGPSSDAGAVRMETVSDATSPMLGGLKRPKNLPDGLTFLDANVVTAPVRMIVATYYNPDSSRSVTLAQTPVADLKAGATGKTTVYAVGEDLDEVAVAGSKAAQVTISADPAWRGARASIVWLSGEAVCQLSGRGTSVEELVKIASSV